MENKKTFGEYICRRRKELGLTQKEFADRLFVTESAVSKWERGLSYPDITLLRDICAVLDISEHELLTASEDTEARRAELLAKKYLTLTRNFRVGQYILYGVILLACLITNLSVNRALDWFWIALPAAGMCASLTLVPALAEKHRCAAVTGAFTLCLELTLLASCLYVGRNWFLTAAMGTLLGLSTVLLPAVLRSVPLPPSLAERKSLVYWTAELVLLLLLLAVCAWSVRADWFPVAAVSVVFGATLVLLPFLMGQLPLPEFWRGRKSLLYFLMETALLLLLLAVCCWYGEGGWFPVAAVSVVFGLTLVCMPLLMGQLPLPEKFCRHKTLLYFAGETALLFLLEAVVCLSEGGHWFFLPGLPLTLYCLLLPWGVMLLIRYAPIGGWFKASLCCGLTAFYHAAFLAVIDRILLLGSGGALGRPLYGIGFQFNFRDWESAYTVSENINAIVCFTTAALAVIYAAVGLWRRKK